MADIWYPNGTKVLGVDLADNTLINIAGESGVGKSRLIRQLLEDPEYGLDEVLIAMSEAHARTTYKLPGRIVPWESLAEIDEIIKGLRAAVKEGRRVPKILAVDSLSGGGDHEMTGYNDDPILTKAGARDKLAEYGKFGDDVRAFYERLNTVELPCDVVVMMTTKEGAKGVELCIPGNIVPANWTRWAAVTLYMKQSETIFDPKVDKPQPRPHRTIHVDEDSGMGRVINRYFYSMNVGEVKAKGHDNLALKEVAYLPAILRKIHGRPEPQGGNK